MSGVSNPDVGGGFQSAPDKNLERDWQRFAFELADGWDGAEELGREL